jgi:hypothetical protein
MPPPPPPPPSLPARRAGVTGLWAGACTTHPLQRSRWPPMSTARQCSQRCLRCNSSTTGRGAQFSQMASQSVLVVPRLPLAKEQRARTWLQSLPSAISLDVGWLASDSLHLLRRTMPAAPLLCVSMRPSESSHPCCHGCLLRTRCSSPVGAVARYLDCRDPATTASVTPHQGSSECSPPGRACRRWLGTSWQAARTDPSPHPLNDERMRWKLRAQALTTLHCLHSAHCR